MNENTLDVFDPRGTTNENFYKISYLSKIKFQYTDWKILLKERIKLDVNVEEFYSLLKQKNLVLLDEIEYSFRNMLVDFIKYCSHMNQYIGNNKTNLKANISNIPNDLASHLICVDIMNGSLKYIPKTLFAHLQSSHFANFLDTKNDVFKGKFKMSMYCINRDVKKFLKYFREENENKSPISGDHPFLTGNISPVWLISTEPHFQYDIYNYRIDDIDI